MTIIMLINPNQKEVERMESELETLKAQLYLRSIRLIEKLIVKLRQELNIIRTEECARADANTAFNLTREILSSVKIFASYKDVLKKNIWKTN